MGKKIHKSRRPTVIIGDTALVEKEARSSVVEPESYKLQVEGAIPSEPTIADVAQPAEQDSCKVEVEGSTPPIGSIPETTTTATTETTTEPESTPKETNPRDEDDIEITLGRGEKKIGKILKDVVVNGERKYLIVRTEDGGQYRVNAKTLICE